MGEARVSFRSWCVGVMLAGAVLPLMGAVEFKPPCVLATRVTIAPPGQPGTPMIVTGRVVDARDRPRAGIVIRVYHADARGIYGTNNGWLKTDSLGRYEVRTTRSGGTPAHIHFIVNNRNEELRFAGEGKRTSGRPDWMNPPIVVASGPGDSFALYRPVKQDRDGVEHVVRDFRLK